MGRVIDLRRNRQEPMAHKENENNSPKSPLNLRGDLRGVTFGSNPHEPVGSQRGMKNVRQDA